MTGQNELFKSKYRQIVDDLNGIGLDFRINDLNESLEVFYDGRWQRLTDTLVSVIKTELREIGYGKKKKGPLGPVQDAWVKLAHEQRYNPIRDYFRTLEGRYEPSSNGPYVNEMFCKFFSNPDGMFSRWLFRWMVGTIAKIYLGERNPMLVLVGSQRIGKSWLARWLCPIDREIYFVEQAIKPDSKDAVLRLTDVLIWEVAELGATTRRADSEALKAFITLRHVQERPAYGRYVIEKPALCSFIGSVNFDGAGFLNDPTGSTRFLACQLDAIDFSYTIQDINQLWAEAYWYFQHVPKAWELTEQEKAIQAQINASYEIVNELEEVIDNAFAFTGEQSDFLTTMDIKNHLVTHGYSVNGGGQAFYRELSRILYKRGVFKARATYQPGQPHRQGWAGIKKVGAQELF